MSSQFPLHHFLILQGFSTKGLEDVLLFSLLFLQASLLPWIFSLRPFAVSAFTWQKVVFQVGCCSSSHSATLALVVGLGDLGLVVDVVLDISYESTAKSFRIHRCQSRAIVALIDSLQPAMSSALMTIASRNGVLEEDVGMESCWFQNRILLLILCFVPALVSAVSFTW